MNRSMGYPLVLICLFAGLFSRAQEPTSALDYFNKAAKEYIKQDKSIALRTLDQGLTTYPGDPKLLKLAEELIKEEEEQQKQEQQQQEQQDQNDQQKKEQEDQQNGDQQEKEQEQSGEKDQEEKDSGDQKENSGQQDQAEPSQEQQPAPGTIAPHDARRMLDALERQEKEVQDKVRAKQRPASRTPIEKDW